MKSIKNGVILTLLVLLTSGCQFIPTGLRPSIEGVKPRITGVDMKGVDLAFDVNVNNPLPVPLKAPRIRYGFAVEQAQLISDEIPAGLDFPAGQTGAATLPVRISYAEISKAVQGLKDINKANYKLDAAMLIPGIGEEIELPFSHSGVVPILKVPKISVQSFNPGNFSLSGAKFGGTAKVANPNMFGVGMQDLGYALQIGDLKVGGLSVSTLGEIAAEGEGSLDFSGEISIPDSLKGILSGVELKGILSGAELGEINIAPCGSLKTPFGSVNLPNFPKDSP
jgi:LEA14-like dessication related protein